MKPTTENPQTQHCVNGKVFFQSCCLNPTDVSTNPTELSLKKTRKFIKLCKNLPEYKSKTKSVLVNHHREVEEPPYQHSYGFHEDKVSFLDQIRKYNPNPETEKD